jgi:hypothetical protein
MPRIRQNKRTNETATRANLGIPETAISNKNIFNYNQELDKQNEERLKQMMQEIDKVKLMEESLN